MSAGRPSGLPTTGGRCKGTPNKATADVKALARQHGPKVIEELVRTATRSESDTARVSAIKELLDRAYGKAAQPVTGANGEGPVSQITRIERVIVDVLDPQPEKVGLSFNG